ncbi:atherin-like [Triticum aestivum]|uniref:atherin-like n=1 Tax=Triticum aestivum TaxID=4565 RepID=UPI001D01E01E|nr:atherin-like [Triticum aestivum]
MPPPTAGAATTPGRCPTASPGELQAPEPPGTHHRSHRHCAATPDQSRGPRLGPPPAALAVAARAAERPDPEKPPRPPTPASSPHHHHHLPATSRRPARAPTARAARDSGRRRRPDPDRIWPPLATTQSTPRRHSTPPALPHQEQIPPRRQGSPGRR